MALVALLLVVGLLTTRAPRAFVTGFGERPRATPEERLRWLADHEAGHAVVAWDCPLVGEVSGMRIEPTSGGEALWHGRVDHDWTEEHSAARDAWDVVIALSGLSAEIITYGQVRTLLMRDLDEALAAARSFCRRGGRWSLPAPPVAMPFRVACAPEDARVLAQAWSVACAIVGARRDAHARLAEAIVARRHLGATELTAILGTRS